MTDCVFVPFWDVSDAEGTFAMELSNIPRAGDYIAVANDHGSQFVLKVKAVMVDTTSPSGDLLRIYYSETRMVTPPDSPDCLIPIFESEAG